MRRANGNDPDQDAPDPSRSARKREAEGLQRLGEALLQLTPEQLGRMPLPDGLREAVDTAHRISARGARRRQRQRIGKLMRSIEVAPIQAALEDLQGVSVRETARHRAAEQWRERMLGGDEAVTAFMAAHPGADQQRLRQLVRSARQDVAADRPPKAARALYRLIHAALDDDT